MLLVAVGAPTGWASPVEKFDLGDDGAGVYVGPQGPFEPLLVPVGPVGAIVGDALHRVGLDDNIRGLDSTFCTVDLVVRVLIDPVVAGGLDPGGEVATSPERPGRQCVSLVLQTL